MALSRATNEKRLATCVGNDLVDLNGQLLDGCVLSALFVYLVATRYCKHGHAHRQLSENELW